MSENNKNIVQPEDFSVKQVFKNVEYVVPIYQRNYAWTKTEIEQLLNDISAVSEKFDGNYYLGTLIVNKIGTNVFEVIDGQQRLTTLYLLLAYLNNTSINGNSLSFEAREKSNKTLQAIFAKKTKNDMGYSGEIINGYSDIENYFKGKIEKDKQFIEKFKNKLDKIIIVRVQVPQNIDLNHYFEIMNTRGEQLELHEIVKAKIIGKINDSDKKTADKYKMVAATIWDACAQMDKYVQMCFKVDVRNNIFGDTWDVFQLNDFDALSNCFNEATESNVEIFKLKDKLNNPQKTAANNIEKKNDDEDKRFESIITFPNFILQVNKAMSEVTKDVTENNEKDEENGLDDNKFIDTMKKRYETSDNAKDFIYNLLKYRYLFDRYIIKREYVGQYKVDGKWSLKKLAATTDSGNSKKPLYQATYSTGNSNDDDETEGNNFNKQLCLLESCLRITYTSPKTMHWVAKVIKEADKQVDKPEDKDGVITKCIIDLLQKYCCRKMGDADYWNHVGFAIERIVFSYLDYLLWREDKSNEFKTFQFQFRNSIEHFYPQTPSDDNHSKVEELNNFGNLALITVSANSKFSNYPPIVKGEHEDIIKQSPKLMIMAQIVKDKGKWEDEEIKEHGEAMLNILNEEMVTKLEDAKDKYPALKIYNKKQ